MTAAKRAIGVVRVSATRGREGESFHSPTTQLDRIRDACEREGLELVEHYKELDVSGTRPLAKRPGLSEAVRAVEEHRADVIVVAYFDRLVRSMKVQAEIVDRVERAGGNVLTLDAGQITNGKAATRLQANILGAIAQFVSDNTRDKVAEAQEAAVKLGIAPWPRVPPGYVRGADKRYVIDPKLAPVIRRAFELRAEGAPISEIRSLLERHGVRYTYSGVYKLLSQRAYLGEIHFQKLSNLAAHPPIVDRPLFDRVQSVIVPRDYQGESNLLLARQSLLYCAACGSRLVANNVKRPYGTYDVYRCKSDDCTERVSITASLIEAHVLEHVQELVSGLVGRANGEARVQEAQRAWKAAEAELERVTGLMFDAGVDTVPAALARVSSAKSYAADARTAYEAALAHDEAATVAITGADVLRDGTLDEKRALITAVIRRITVAQGRGLGRVTIESNTE